MFETENQDGLIDQDPETELEQGEEEVGTESDEESSGQSEYGEEDAELSQDQDSDTEEVDDDFRVVIPVSKDDGDIEEVELSAEQLADMVAKSRDFEKLDKKVREAEATVSQSRQLVEFVSTHPVVSRVTWLYANGYSNEQVISHLQEILNMSQNNNQQHSDPNFDMLDDYQKAAFMSMKQQFEQERQARLDLEQRIQKADNERTIESVGQHNSRTFDSAISSLNLDFTGNENDLRKIRAAAEALYPNVNLATWKFSKDQAEAILSRAGLAKRTSKSGTKINQANKSKTAPRVLGGTKTPGNNRRQAPPQKSGPLSMEDRRKSLLSMGLG
jgi:hypothetical protein